MKRIILSLPLLLASSLSLASAYEDYFPAFYEYCAASRYKEKKAEKPGGPGGHGFTYVHGLCKDYRTPFPQVIPCSDVSPELREKHPHGGVGISLDKNYQNAYWVAVPGHDLTLFGERPRQSITEADITHAINRVTDLKVFEGVVMRQESLEGMKPGSEEYLRTVALDTMGTDYAVNWARELHCARIPVPAARLAAAAKFLNDVNNKYKAGPGYTWDKFKNNCAHLSINLAEALGINQKIKVDQKMPKSLFNMALPSNVFLMYADLAVLSSPKKSRLAKSPSFKRHGFYPLQVGSLISKHPIYPGVRFEDQVRNALTAPRLFKPFKLLATPSKYGKKHLKPANVDLKANAAKWAPVYRKMLSQIPAKGQSSSLAQYLKQQSALSERILSDQ